MAKTKLMRNKYPTKLKQNTAVSRRRRERTTKTALVAKYKYLIQCEPTKKKKTHTQKAKQ